MKIVLRVLIILIVLAVLAIGIFIATFDAERYRPLLVSKLEEALGQPVEVQSLSLGWHRGIAVDVGGLKIYPREDKAKTKPAVEAKSIQGVLKLGALVRKQIQVSGILVSGLRLHVVRTPEGRVEVAGISLPAGAGSPKPAETGQAPAEPPSAGRAKSGKGAPAAGPGLSLFVDRIEAQDSTLALTDLSAKPPLDVTVQGLKLLARLEPNRLNIKDLSGRIGEGTFSARGTAADFLQGKPDIEIQFKAENLPLDAILPSSAEGRPQLRGKLLTSLQLRMAQERLTGDGTVRIDAARLENVNVLKELFDRLSVLPGLSETLLARLPDSYRQKLLEKDTLFEPIEFRVKANGEEIAWEGLRVASDTFEIRGSGQANLKGALLFPAEIRLESALSGAIIRSVEDLGALTDEQGRLTMPVLLQGTLPNLSVLPDVNYVAQRLIASKGQELVGNLLEKVFKKH